MPSSLRAPRRSKFRNVVTEVDGIRFASKKEAKRYAELKLLEKIHEIERLKLQPEFQLEVNDQPICKYRGDFQYINRRGELIVEDAKGFKTPEYRLKKKLMLAIHDIEIQEV